MNEPAGDRPAATAVAPMLSQRTSIFAQLGFWPKFGLIFLWIFAIAYGGLVEVRGALIKDRHTDVDTYFRGAWAIRNGTDPYTITDTNGWHYIYPPLFAILISPLADPPERMNRHGYLPYAASVGIWYALSVACFVAGVVMLARRLEATLDEEADKPVGVSECGGVGVEAVNSDTPTPPHSDASSRQSAIAHRWWALRFWPILLCLPATCRSVIRGQVGPLWLLLICGMIAALLSRKPIRAGLWLAGAICLKVIPLYLLLYPIWRRNWRMLAGCAIGMIVGLVIIPLIAMGPQQFAATGEHYLERFILPAVGGRRIDTAVERELMNPNTSDRQSFVSVLTNIGHFVFGAERTFESPRFAQIGHVLLGGAMTLLTLLAANWRRRDDDAVRVDGLAEAVFVGLLVLVMLPVAPVTHSHYFIMVLPLVAAVWAVFYEPNGRAKWTASWIALMAAIPISHIITATPALKVFRETGLVTWVSVIVWAAITVMLWRRTRTLSSSSAGVLAPRLSSPKSEVEGS